MSRYQKGKTNLDFTEATDSEWQWHQLGRMQVCNSLQTDNHHASTPPLSFFQAGCPSCRPTNSVKALKAQTNRSILPLETASSGNKHCANCIGTLSFPIAKSQDYRCRKCCTNCRKVRSTSRRLFVFNDVQGSLRRQ